MTTGNGSRCYWAEECSFGDFMILTDDHLELLIGRTTTQTELDYLADLQESKFTPHEAAWVIAKESFPDLGKIEFHKNEILSL